MLVDNIAYACTTKWCENGNASEEIIHWINADLTESSYSYTYFEKESNEIANLLQKLGVRSGDVVSVFLPRSPILISSVFGILKLQVISSVLFSTLGEEALLDRLENSEAKVVITKNSLVRKILAIKDKLPNLRYILVVDLDEHRNEFVLSLSKLMEDVDDIFDYPHQLDSETPAFLQYTSGSTGKPKGALHVHAAIQDIVQSYKEIMKIEQDDLYWCTADPAWITGLCYGVFAPLSTNVTQIQYGGTYNAEHWLKILKEKQITVWYTAPTALRMLMQEDAEKFEGMRSSDLKRIYSVGEPLNPEIYHWGCKVFGKEIYDNWFQSETGSIMISNRPGLEVKPGSMGKPRKGIEPLILNDEMQPASIGEHGHLAVCCGWNSMFRSYYKKRSCLC